jgi:beta-amylase
MPHVCHSCCAQSKIGEENPDIFYTDKAGYRNRECLSLGCDEEPVLAGRAPVEVYSDFIEAFSDSFDHMFGARVNCLGPFSSFG